MPLSLSLCLDLFCSPFPGSSILDLVLFHFFLLCFAATPHSLKWLTVFLPLHYISSAFLYACSHPIFRLSISVVVIVRTFLLFLSPSRHVFIIRVRTTYVAYVTHAHIHSIRSAAVSLFDLYISIFICISWSFTRSHYNCIVSNNHCFACCLRYSYACNFSCYKFIATATIICIIFECRIFLPSVLMQWKQKKMKCQVNVKCLRTTFTHAHNLHQRLGARLD